MVPKKGLTGRLKELGYRFYNRRAEFIVDARKHFGIKKKVSEFADGRAARTYLVENVKGLGYKEASHFLRNTGFDNVAILDRHILRIMNEHGIIQKIPAHLTGKNYLEFEAALDKFAEKAKVNHSLLDLYLWYLKTGKILK